MVRHLFFILLFFLNTLNPSIADDDVPSPAAPQVKELLGTLSKLVDNKEKEEINSKNNVTIKIEDLQGAVRVLENPEDRKKVATALKGLIKIQSEEAKKENIIQKASLNITGVLEKTTEALLKAVVILGHIPDIFTNEIKQFHDQKYRHDFLVLIFTLIVSLCAAAVFEYGIRKLLYFLKIRRPTEFILKRMPIHAIRNVTPVIFFGLIAYAGVYFTHGSWTFVTLRGFYMITFIIIIRTAWLVIRVLFISRQTQYDPQNSTFETSSYHFILALLQLITIGVVFAEISLLFGMGKIFYEIWLKIIGFGVVSLMIVGITKIRFIIGNHLKFEADIIDGVTIYFAKCIELIGGYWHWIVSLWLSTVYILWLTRYNTLAWLGFSSLIFIFMLTIVFVVGRQAIVHFIQNYQAKLRTKESTIAIVSLGYLEGSLGRGIIFIWHVLYFVLFLEICGFEPIDYLSHSKAHPYLTRVITILITFLIIRALWLWVNYIAKIQMAPRKMGRRTIEPSQFIKTLTPILKSLAHWFLAIMTIILVMVELKIPVEPLLYFFGIFSIAISLGSQSLIKDLINGVLNLMEGNIVVGEVITIGNNTGTVETLSLRGLSLRHSNGSLQSITFSEITNIINKSRNYTVVPVEISVPYHTDIGVVHKVLLSAYTDICKDPVHGKNIIDPLNISGIDRFNDNGFVVTGNIKVRPDPKNRFLKAFNQCLKVRLEAEGILPPASQRVINLNVDMEKDPVQVS